jgi:hypothetical protein
MEASDKCDHYSTKTAFDIHTGNRCIAIDSHTGEVILQETSGGVYFGDITDMDFCDLPFPGKLARIYGVDMMRQINIVKDHCTGDHASCPVFKGEVGS